MTERGRVKIKPSQPAEVQGIDQLPEGRQGPPTHQPPPSTCATRTWHFVFHVMYKQKCIHTKLPFDLWVHSFSKCSSQKQAPIKTAKLSRLALRGHSLEKESLLDQATHFFFPCKPQDVRKILSPLPGNRTCACQSPSRATVECLPNRLLPNVALTLLLNTCYELKLTAFHPSPSAGLYGLRSSVFPMRLTSVCVGH